MVSPLVFLYAQRAFVFSAWVLWLFGASTRLLAFCCLCQYSWTFSTLWRTASLPVQCLCLQHSANVRNPQMQCMTYFYNCQLQPLHNC